MTLDQVITLLGGEEAVRRACKCGGSAVSNWRSRGLPPGRKYELLLLAKRLGVRLTAEQLASIPSPGRRRCAA
jgi:hypothetical protein